MRRSRGVIVGRVTCPGRELPLVAGTIPLADFLVMSHLKCAS
jgi:hypothetical protein